MRPMRAAYVIGGATICAARSIMWSLESCDEMNVFGIDRMIRTLSTLHLSLSNLTPELASISSSILVASSESVPNQPNLIEDYFLEDEDEDILTAINMKRSGLSASYRLPEEDARRAVELGASAGTPRVKGWDKVRRLLLPALALEVKVRREREAAYQRARQLRATMKLPSECTPMELLESWAVRSGRASSHVRGYYSLLRLHVDSIVKAATDRPRRFSKREWEALLIADVSRRLVRVSDMDR
jgi:hypothetical protein